MLRNYRNMLVTLTRRCPIGNRCCARWNNNRSLRMSPGHDIVDCLNIICTISSQ